MLSLLAPSAHRRPDMQPKLTRINQRKKILTKKWHQYNKRDHDDSQTEADDQARVPECPVQPSNIKASYSFETAIKPFMDANKPVAPTSLALFRILRLMLA